MLWPRPQTLHIVDKYDSGHQCSYALKFKILWQKMAVNEFVSYLYHIISDILNFLLL